jgi:hypothetical protein
MFRSITFSGAAALASGITTIVGIGYLRNEFDETKHVTNAAAAHRKHICSIERKFVPNCGDFQIFSGSAHRELANSVARNLGTSLSPASIGRFNDGEVSVKVSGL